MRILRPNRGAARSDAGDAVWLQWLALSMRRRSSWVPSRAGPRLGAGIFDSSIAAAALEEMATTSAALLTWGPLSGGRRRRRLAGGADGAEDFHLMGL